MIITEFSLPPFSARSLEERLSKEENGQKTGKPSKKIKIRQTMVLEL